MSTPNIAVSSSGTGGTSGDSAAHKPLNKRARSESGEESPQYSLYFHIIIYVSVIALGTSVLSCEQCELTLPRAPVLSLFALCVDLPPSPCLWSFLLFFCNETEVKLVTALRARHSPALLLGEPQGLSCWSAPRPLICYEGHEPLRHCVSHGSNYVLSCLRQPRQWKDLRSFRALQPVCFYLS